MNTNPSRTKAGAAGFYSAIRNPQSAILLLLLGLLLFLSWREDYWLDEGYSLRRIEASWTQLYNPLAVRVAPPADPAAPPAEPFDKRDVYDLNPPLYFALVRILAGSAPSPLVVRGFFSALPMILALGFILRLIRSAGGDARAAWAALLLGVTAPAVIYYGHEARPYALPLAVACALLWGMEKLNARPWRLALACLLAAAAGALMHYAFAWWILTLMGIFAVRGWTLRRDAAARRAALAGIAGLAAGSALALAACLPALAQLARCTRASTTTLSSEVMMNTFALPFSRIGSRPASPALGFALQFALIAAAGWKLRTAPDRARGLAALALWLGPLALPVLMKLFFNMAYYERYAFFSLPGWFLTVAWVLECDPPPTTHNSQLKTPLPLRIPLLLLFAMLLFNLHWCARNLGRPIRAQWRPAIETLLRDSKPDEAYTIDPDLMNSTFAVMARRPPAARWFSFTQGVPPGARAIWILTETHINPDPRYEFDPREWKTERLMAHPGVSLYRVRRL